MTPHESRDLEKLVKDAVDGKAPVLNKEMGRELLGLLKLLNAPTKHFDPAALSDVIMVDVVYEGLAISPGTEKITISIGAAGQTRQIKLPAGLALFLAEQINDAVVNEEDFMEELLGS